MRRRDTWRRRGRPVLWCVVAGGGYAAGSLVAFRVLDAAGSGPSFFPSAGLSVALLCLLPRRARAFVCASIAAAEIIVDLAQGLGIVAAAGFAVANTAEPMLAALLLGTGRIDTWYGLTRFLAAAVLAAPAVGALTGAVTVVLATKQGDGWWNVAGRWWLGDALGVLVIGTTLLAWGQSSGAGRHGGRIGPLVSAAAMGGIAALVFWVDAAAAGYVGVVALAWVALRYGLKAVTASGVVIAFVATTATVAKHGPWASGPQTGLVHLQVLLAVVLLTMLVLAVTVTERDAAMRSAATAEERQRQAQSVAEAEHEAHERARLLQATAEGLGAATNVPGILRAILDVQGEHGIPARAAIGVLVNGTALRTTLGGDEQAAAIILPLTAAIPEAATVRDGAPRFPAGAHALPGTVLSATSAAILPLRTSDAVFGFLALYFREDHIQSSAQRTVQLTMAAQAAQAVQRVELYEAEQLLRRRAEDGERRQRLIGDVLAAVSTSGTVSERARKLVDALVPTFADFAVALFGEDGSDSPVAVCARGDEAARTAAGTWQTADGGISALTTVMATGKPLRPAAGPSGSGRCSLIGVPFTAAGSVEGALLVGHAGSGRSFAEQDFALVEEVAARAALVLHSSRSADRERSIALILQTSQLPQHVTAPPGLAAATRYQPSEQHLAIGGDWYDLVSRPDGTITVTIGDVVGHGLAAAAAMGQMRSTATALILADLGPAAVLDRLDLVATRTAGAEHASALVAELDPASGRLRYANAGHPPPLLITPDGTVALLDQARTALLCLPPGTGRTEAQISILPGSALLCYTDGLIEQNRLPQQEAFAGLIAAATRYAHLSPDELCDGLLDTLVGRSAARDDIAVVCLRLLQVPASGPEVGTEPLRPPSFRRAAAE
ncbi:SpoIIE family protein phosphatase [Amycolatopsis sp. NPDC004625]|uniref:SpoIIE family protein phosphatase n=1 Tax=Amycolatopsis sp. NPDC004625 TaxID=3154670 RepID=UPI0033A9265D